MNWLVALVLVLTCHALDLPRWSLYVVGIGAALGLYVLGVR